MNTLELKDFCLKNINTSFSSFMKLLEDTGYTFTVRELKNNHSIELAFNEDEALIHIDLTGNYVYQDLLDSAGYNNFFELDDYIEMFYVEFNIDGKNEKVIGYYNFLLLRNQFTNIENIENYNN